MLTGRSGRGLFLLSVLRDFVTPSNLNAIKFLTCKDNLFIDPELLLLCSRAMKNLRPT